jgi:hypothetical protein
MDPRRPADGTDPRRPLWTAEDRARLDGLRERYGGRCAIATPGVEVVLSYTPEGREDPAVRTSAASGAEAVATLAAELAYLRRCGEL